jgi:hypothetical protein
MTQNKMVEPGTKTCDEMRKKLKRNYLHKTENRRITIYVIN